MNKQCLLALAWVLLAACSQKKRTDELDCKPDAPSQLASCEASKAPYFCISGNACPSSNSFCSGSYAIYASPACSCQAQSITIVPGEIQYCSTNTQPDITTIHPENDV